MPTRWTPAAPAGEVPNPAAASAAAITNVETHPRHFVVIYLPLIRFPVVRILTLIYGSRHRVLSPRNSAIFGIDACPFSARWTDAARRSSLPEGIPVIRLQETAGRLGGSGDPYCVDIDPRRLVETGLAPKADRV